MTNLLQQLLEEQQDLTAVERFAQMHADGQLPAQQQYYSKLLPASPPAQGQQFAFNVDLDKCSGCKACVTACHSLNGLDDSETWRDVGLLIGGTAELPIMQHVTTACHHCIDPACATACPVNAYEKNPVTGIVKHLDDQCIGCQYCILACPYEVPKYNAAKGIVRKCDMCSDRLAVGEAPACVQACPHEAISIGVVNVDEVLESAGRGRLVATAPDSNFTKPTTTYFSRKTVSSKLLAADSQILILQHAHWPLIIMLVLTQLSIGMFATGLLTNLAGSQPLAAAIHATVALLLGLLALGASTCHLGRPLYAFRAVIGLRHSWLSREIVVFGGFAGAAVTYVCLSWLKLAPDFLPGVPAAMTSATGWSAVAIGLLGVFCSVMIYVFTQRQFWKFGQTATKFLLTCPILGIATTWITLAVIAVATGDERTHSFVVHVKPWFVAALFLASLSKLTVEASLFAHLKHSGISQLKRTAKLMTSQLRNITLARFVAGTLGGVLLPVATLLPLSDNTSLAVVATAFAGCVSGELLERYLYFTAVSPDKMPGAF